jgi:PAS domain S-box-containing protein
MNKRFEAKKETAIWLGNFYKALDAENTSPVTADENWESKYTLLLQRYKKLEDAFSFHRDIVQTISSAIITIDGLGNITFVNQSALKILQYSLKELQGVKISHLFVDKEEAEKIVDQLRFERVVFESKETQFKTKNNKIIPVGFSSTQYEQNCDKNKTGFILIFRNISMATNFRKQIERMDRLAMLGELAAGIAHEIRNPLGGIKTSAQVLEESFGLGDSRSELVMRIVKEVDRSNGLLKQFFNFAKPNRPKQDLYDIEMVIDGVYLLLAPKMKKKNIIFHKDFGADIPQVFIDDHQLEQVILNLFLNAIDAIKSKGKITVKTEIINAVKLFDEEKLKDCVAVCISDTGEGIASEKLEKIFNPFYTSKGDGVGLGLSISTRLLEENGGKIDVESKPGEGSSFTFYLPIPSS